MNGDVDLRGTDSQMGRFAYIREIQKVNRLSSMGKDEVKLYI
jgi:hypothetical protein